VTRFTWVSVVVAAAAYLLAWIGWEQGWAWLAAFDAWSLAEFGRAASGSNARFAWDLFCTVFSPTVLRILTVPLIVWLLIRRRRPTALFVFMTVEVSGIVTELAKWLADRPRPATAMVYAYGTSFPSGHALGITVIVLAALTFVLPLVAESWRPMVIALGVLLIVGIGVARVVLNVHHPSDVIAGWALGYVYFVLSYRFLRPDGKPAVRGITP
jgi:membrane-associated phospholipid phosphatase